MNRYKNISTMTQIFYVAGRKYVVAPQEVVVLEESIAKIYGFLQKIGTVENTEPVGKKKSIKE